MSRPCRDLQAGLLKHTEIFCDTTGHGRRENASQFKLCFVVLLMPSFGWAGLGWISTQRVETKNPSRYRFLQANKAGATPEFLCRFVPVLCRGAFVDVW
jgi:hypothetical protein